MKTYPWLKLYVELLDDVKMERLSDGEFRFWIFLLCMARESTTPGVVTMDEDGMAWRIRRPLEFVRKGLRACIGAGLVVAEAEGFVLPKFTVRNVDRKPEKPEKVAARMRKWREKHGKRVTQPVTQRGYARVTQTVTTPRCTTRRDAVAEGDVTESETACFEDEDEHGPRHGRST